MASSQISAWKIHQEFMLLSIHIFSMMKSRETGINADDLAIRTAAKTTDSAGIRLEAVIDSLWANK